MGFGCQYVAGIVPWMISFPLLIAADARRCPVALGAGQNRLFNPFTAFAVGVGLGLYTCERMTRGSTRNASIDWVLWGSLAEVPKLMRRLRESFTSDSSEDE